MLVVVFITSTPFSSNHQPQASQPHIIIADNVAVGGGGGDDDPTRVRVDDIAWEWLEILGIVVGNDGDCRAELRPVNVVLEVTSMLGELLLIRRYTKQSSWSSPILCSSWFCCVWDDDIVDVYRAKFKFLTATKLSNPSTMMGATFLMPLLRTVLIRSRCLFEGRESCVNPALLLESRRCISVSAEMMDR